MPRFRHGFVCLLTALLLGVAAPAPASAQDGVPPRVESLSLLEGAAVARSVYVPWSVGRQDQALERLDNLNTALRDSLYCWGHARLALVYLAAEQDPDALLAAAQVSIEAFVRSQRRGDLRLVVQEMRLLEVLADWYDERATTPERRDLADFLRFQVVALQSQLRDEESLLDARDALERILKDRPDHVTALRFAGNVQELLGRPERAVPHLRRAVEAEPTDAPTRLRLALNLLRAGDDEEQAERLLTELARDPAVGWWSVVAAQEMTRRLHRSRGAASALAFLDSLPETMTRRPDLVLLATSVAGSVGGDAGRRVAALLDDWHQEDAMDPRFEYDRGPIDQLAARAESLRPALSTASGGLPAALAAIPEDPDVLSETLFRHVAMGRALRDCRRLDAVTEREARRRDDTQPRAPRF